MSQIIESIDAWWRALGPGRGAVREASATRRVGRHGRP